MRTDAEAVAAALPAAFASARVDAICDLMAAGVRWGRDEDTPETCHNRDNVRRHLETLFRGGLEVTVDKTAVVGSRILASLSYRFAVRSAPPIERFEIMTVVDGKVADIRPATNRFDARRRLRA
ncbi:MAG: hypothetical protein JWL73_2885 [Actinomycetia bacterium]|nr:hypothetical protein [Actinomycetes bacterium]